MSDKTSDETNGFSADWLRRREPFDLAARSGALASGFKAALAQQAPSGWRIVDLASGSGANFRALAPLLEADQEWTLIDHDPLLLAAQRTDIVRWATRHGWRCQDQQDALLINAGTVQWLVQSQQLDLARNLEDIDLAPCHGLVTTAFLDLVSAAWLDRLAALLTHTRRPFLSTLTVDGRRTWHPGRPADPLISEAFLAHQGGDKGFGPSLGVQATHYLADRLAEKGYEVSTQTSDWVIGTAHRHMLQALITEAAAVATEMLAKTSTPPANAHTVTNWLAERSADIQQSLLSMKVGHLDLLAAPPDKPQASVGVSR